jgi:hypothetical protein
MQDVKAAIRENDLLTGLSQLQHLLHQGFMIKELFQTALPQAGQTIPELCYSLSAV